MASHHDHICGFYYVDHTTQYLASSSRRRYLPLVSLTAHATIISSVCRSTLSQTFDNPASGSLIPELRYTFPLYDGVSVVGFVCTINNDRVIKGVVKERQEAKEVFNDAVARGETAGLFEQLPDAADVFTTTIGNVPAGAQIKVDITYLGELKHDAEVNGIRFTVPTSIAPRYGSYPGQLAAKPTNATGIPNGISITVDVEMPLDTNIKSVQSPSHPIAVAIGSLSTATPADSDTLTLRRASATLALGTAELAKDFIMHVVTTNTGNPVAVLETHPTLGPHHQALMATLVPKFALPASRPEIVFLCDRSGSMSGGGKIPNLRSALHIFLKSLPVGVKFNICSFGSRYSYLFADGSRTLSQASMDEATRYVDTIGANFGGTEMHAPLENVFSRRYKDMDLEVFVLTDGEIWDQASLFSMVNKHVGESKGAIRVFTLGVGDDVSHSLIGGLARAGNGFSQAVSENEKMNSKVVRMLKAALTPHVNDYSLEIKYDTSMDDTTDDGFELVEQIKEKSSNAATTTANASTTHPATTPQQPASASGKPTISLFDLSADLDAEIKGDKYAGLPAVVPPKWLQTPFDIPPLYPFNRTSVYILMPEASPSRTPRSVVLRGTCKHGPLELEIPVTVLPDKAETIHQLAARSAIRELEEGRGWLYSAKDDDASGQLLKDRYEGRFSDMVEREAVRLGVQYQVGGKWCSFVAVDTSGEKTTTTATPQPPPPPAYENLPHGPFRSAARAAPRSRMAMAAAPAPAAAAIPTSFIQSRSSQSYGRGGFALRGGGSPRRRLARTAADHGDNYVARPFGSAAPPPPCPPPQASALMTQPTGGFVSAECSFPKPGSGYGSAPTGMMPYSDGFAALPTQEKKKKSNGIGGVSFLDTLPHNDQHAELDSNRSLAQLMSSVSEANTRRQFQTRDREAAAPRPGGGVGGGGLLMGIGVAATAAPKLNLAESLSLRSASRSSRRSSASTGPEGAVQSTAPTAATDLLDAIVALQSFEGSWAWSHELFSLLGTSVAAVEAVYATSYPGVVARRDVMATGAVVAFLRSKMAAREEEWEMLVEKAEAWIDGQMLSVSADSLVAAANTVF